MIRFRLNPRRIRYVIQLIYLLILISSLLFSRILAASLRAPRYRHSAISSVVSNDSMVKILLMHVEKDPKLRLISTTFMRAFDESCTMQLLLLDPRIKSIIKDEDDQTIICPIGTFLPISVPLLKLYCSHLNFIYPLNKKSFDEKFPALEIPEDATAEMIINLRSNQNHIDLERFLEMLRTIIHKEYSKSSQYNHPPMKLYSFYRLLVAIFSWQTFINEVEKFISFPMEKLILFAASNILKPPHGAEILSRFSINSRPRTILTAISFGNPDLVRAILNNSQNDLLALMDQRTFEKELLGPMHKAANQGNVEIINLLLERGFPADVERSGGIRPIHLASMWGNYDAAVRLFEFDKDVTSSPQKFGDSPAAMVEAAQNGNIRIVEFF